MPTRPQGQIPAETWVPRRESSYQRIGPGGDEPVEGVGPPPSDGASTDGAKAAAAQAKERAAAQVDERTTQVGQQVGEQAQALDGVAGALREQGKDGPAKIAEQASQRVQGAGAYLEQADGQELLAKAQHVAQDNPAAAAAVGAAAGASWPGAC